MNGVLKTAETKIEFFGHNREKGIFSQVSTVKHGGASMISWNLFSSTKPEEIALVKRIKINIKIENEN